MRVHPTARKRSAVSKTVATVIPEIGLAEAPICPQMRLDTDTKRKAKATARIAPMRFMPICGSRTIAAITSSTPTTTTFIESSRSVRSPPPARSAPCTSPNPARMAAQIIGMARTSETSPAVVTAPAPI